MLFVKRLGGGSPLAPTTQSTQPCSTHSSAPHNSCAGPPKAQFVLTPLLTSEGFSPWACGCARVFVCLSAKVDCASVASVLAENSVYRATDGSRALSTSPRSRQLVSPAGRGEGERRRHYRANHPESLQTCRKQLINIGYFRPDISEQNSLIKPTVPFYLL